MFSWNDLKKPIIGLSPMADMTDTPFNLICKSYGVPVIFREMISSEATIRKNQKTLDMAEFDEGERPVIQQIFGSKPKTMAEAARIIEESFHPDGIDINMGCPVYKLTSNFDGAALMKDSELASEIVKAVKGAVKAPVSVKTRLGWSDDTDCLEFVKRIEHAGADLISIHGRTKTQGYAGTANWKRIGEAKANVSIPVLANGDIKTVDDAREALKQSNADGFLIGRGALGNPWFFEELVAELQETGSFTPPSMKDRVETVKKHADLHIEHYGEKGLVKLRKHLPFYFKGMKGWKEVRAKLVRVSTRDELESILVSIT
jgi:tRNA-dihydrouridine synthase B